jgi:hypothetical protein
VPTSRAVPAANASLHGLERADGWTRARLELDGADHLIGYRLAGVEPDEGYEPFVVAMTPIAMKLGVPLNVPASISPRLRQGMLTAQRTLHAWHPELRPIEIVAPGERTASSDGRGVACFFTAGVDSFYSALRHRDRLDALIHVHGFDVPLADRARREQVSPNVRRAAEALELPLVEVETDLRLVSNRYALWGTQYHGAALASVALLTATRFGEVLIPATHSYRDLLPWGSHPLLDPLWSTEGMELVHDGAVPRPEKLRLLGESEIAMRHLRVCFRHSLHGVSGLNCGRCEKCLRTMAGLRAVGALERCETFPGDLPLRKLARVPVGDENAMAFTRENLAAARAAGDEELVRALRRMARLGPWRARWGRGLETASRRLRRGGRRTRRRVRRLRRRSARRVAHATRVAARRTGRG